MMILFIFMILFSLREKWIAPPVKSWKNHIILESRVKFH